MVRPERRSGVLLFWVLLALVVGAARLPAQKIADYDPALTLHPAASREFCAQVPSCEYFLAVGDEHRRERKWWTTVNRSQHNGAQETEGR